MTILIGSFTMGLILSFLALGVFVNFRIFGFADLTAEGSFTLGGAIAATLITAGVNPIIATIAAVLGGFLAGTVTGTLNSRFKINQLLAGILVMISLYSINLRIMGKSNTPLLNESTVFSWITGLSQNLFGNADTVIFGWKTAVTDITMLAVMLILVMAIGFLMHLFFRTGLGTAMRATGNNPQMIKAQGENNELLLTVGIAMSNALVALSGAMLTQYQGFADIQMGIGMMVWGMASLIIGEALTGARTPGISIIAGIMGAVLFRLLVSIALQWGMNPNDLKLITAVFVLASLALPGLLKRFREKETEVHA